MRLTFLNSKPTKAAIHYRPLGTEDEHIFFAPVTAKRSSRRWLWFCFITLWNVLLAGFAVYGINTYVNGAPPKPVVCYCGSSIAEAKTLGCKYDTLSVSWLPKHCRDDDLTAEFDRSGPGPNGEWPYWADVNATQPITVEGISQLAGLPPSRAVFYTSHGWHIAHCAFFWRKEFRMRARGSMMEKRHDQESHIEHCYGWFKKRTPLNSTGTMAFVSLGGEGFPPEDEEPHGHPAHRHNR